MANRKDYTEIKKRRNYLPDFMVNWNRLPEYLSETNQEVQALQISNIAVGKITSTVTGVAQGDPLTIGELYTIEAINGGDDFSNVGFISVDTPFLATGTTPNTWENLSSVTKNKNNIVFFYNDIDINMNVFYTSSGNISKLKITNNKFQPLKTYISIERESTITLIDENTITFDRNLTDEYFKIEIYA